MKKRLIGLNLILFLIVPLCSYAGVPIDTIEAQVNKVLDVLRDPALKGEMAKDATKEKIRSISSNMFDFTELSRRTLGRKWKKLNNNQRKEFIDLYTELLEKAYMNRILKYTDEKVVFHKEKMLTEKKAEVQSNIITRTAEIPIHYSLILKNGKWRVYDVIIEGVSLVKNYPTQFKRILVNKSPEDLLEILRKKVGKV